MRSRSLPWSEIISFYTALVNESGWALEPMIDVAKLLASPPYAGALFAYTSHDILCVSRSENFELGDSELRIQFNPATSAFKFTYRQKASDSTPWARKCLIGEWQSVLTHILQKRLRWFHGNAAA
jgi:hypothetical protein